MTSCHRAHAYWARFLGIEPADWMEPGVSFRAHVGLRGYQGMWCFRHNERVVVSAPTAWLAHVEELWGAWDPQRLMDQAAVVASLGDECKRCIGLAFQGCIDAGRLRDVEAPQARAVVASDQVAVERFRGQCGEDAWSVSGLSAVGTLAYVCVDGAEITAMGGFREKSDGVGDLCVLVHPRFRGRRRGAAVVRAVTADALAKGHLVSYQTLESNRAAVKLALSVGFVRYGNHLPVRLRHDAPAE